jgi:hypothetical protein
VITKDLITAKDYYTYSINILRQEKIIRDDGVGGGSARGQSGRWVFFG